MLRLITATGIVSLWLVGSAFALPDLVVSELRVTPSSAGVGDEILIETAIRNIGDAPVVSPGPSITSTSSDIAVVSTPTTAVGAGAYLTGWGPTRTLAPGDTERYSTRVRVPASGPANSGYVCAVVDNPNAVAEANEANNRRCVNFNATTAKANLVIRRITIGAVSGLSRRVSITMQNTGSLAANDFRVDAYQLAPERWQLLLTTCPQTTRGGSASCAAVWGSLAPGATTTFEGYLTFPADRPSGRRETVEFMADGCFARLEPSLPAYCRIDESNEADNTRRASVAAP